MVNTIVHVVEVGDPDIDTAWCKNCSFRYKHQDRNKIRAEAFRHIANVLDPSDDSSKE